MDRQTAAPEGRREGGAEKGCTLQLGDVLSQLQLRVDSRLSEKSEGRDKRQVMTKNFG